MGSFKKTLICTVCGAEFETEKLSGQKPCGRCSMERSHDRLMNEAPAHFAESFNGYMSDDRHINNTIRSLFPRDALDFRRPYFDNCITLSKFLHI